MGGRLIHEVDLYTSKYGNYKLSWLIGKMSLCGQVDKRVDSDPEVGVQVQMSKKEILEYRWEDEGGVGK